MKNIVILTGSELRHRFFRKYVALNPGVRVLASFCEGEEKSYTTFIKKQTGPIDLREKHLIAREQAEQDFFGLFVDRTPDKSNPIFLPYGEINSPKYINQIIALKPDAVVASACSLIREPLVSMFPGKFLNSHLGLSPYYRGSATNYWPLVNNEPEYVGATFMHIDPGTDTGEIIHQIRPKIVWGDTPGSIGNRLIRDMAEVYSQIILAIDHLPKMPQLPRSATDRNYLQKDYTEESVVRLYENFKSGLVEQHLREKEVRCAKVPIVSNPIVA